MRVVSDRGLWMLPLSLFLGIVLRGNAPQPMEKTSFSKNAANPANVARADDFARITDRYREFLLRTPSQATDGLRAAVAVLDADGRWPDVDYDDARPANWKTSEHLTRVRALSHALADSQSPLHNDAGCQAVRFTDNTVMTVFYAPGTLGGGAGKTLLKTDRACLVLRSERGVWVSDPTQKGGPVTLTVASETVPADLPADGRARKVR